MIVVGTKDFDARIGETIQFDFAVQDDAGKPLNITGATVMFAWRKKGTLTNLVERACSIAGTHVYFTLASAETVTKGTFQYECRIKLLSGETKSLVIGEVIMLDALMTTI